MLQFRIMNTENLCGCLDAHDYVPQRREGSREKAGGKEVERRRKIVLQQLRA